MPAGKNSWRGHASPLVSNDPIPASQDHHLDPLLFKVAFQESILHSGGGKMQPLPLRVPQNPVAGLIA